MRRLRPLIGLLALAMAAALLPVATVDADPLIPSTLSLADPGDVDFGTDVVLAATVTDPATGYDGDGATITFTPTAGGGGALDCGPVPVSTSSTTCDLGSGLDVGTHTYHATYSGNTTVAGTTSDDMTFEVMALPPDPVPSTVVLTGPSPASVVFGTDVTLTANVTDPATGYDGDGATITFTPTAGGGGAIVCPPVTVSTSGTTCDLGSGVAVGTHTYEAHYSGNATTDPSTSAPFTFEVTAVPDTDLDATGVTIDHATFYPAKDGYRDTLKISGMRNEPITVTIKIYGPTGKRIKTVNLGLAGGAYSYKWSGRSSSGKILAAGKYKIVQTLRDLAGNSLVVTKYATLSHKKLVTKTKYVTKLGKSITASAGLILVHRTIGYAKLDAKRYGILAVGYSFSIPKATRYKSIAFQIYAKGPKSTGNELSMQDFVWCTYDSVWSLDCFDHARGFGSSSLAWHKTSGSPSANRSGTHARGAVYVNHGVVYIYKVRVKVVYQVLR